MPCILTFAGGFATSVSSNSPQISSLCAVMDGNIWFKIVETVVWNFRWKLFTRTEAPCFPLSKNTWNKPKIILKAHKCSPVWQLPRHTKLVQPQLCKCTSLPFHPFLGSSFCWQDAVAKGDRKDVQLAFLPPALSAADPIYVAAEPLASKRPSINVTGPFEEFWQWHK